MWRTAKQLAPLFFQGFWVWAISIFAGIVGLALDVTGQVAIPWWLWALLAVLAIVAALIRAFHVVRMQRDAYRPGLRYDVSLEELLINISGPEIFDTGHLNKLGHILKQIQQEAHLRTLLVWGRFNCPEGHEGSFTLSPIPSELWRDHYIDPLTVIVNHGGRMTGTAHESRWSDFHFNSEQVKQVWPCKKLRDGHFRFCGWEIRRV